MYENPKTVFGKYTARVAASKNQLALPIFNPPPSHNAHKPLGSSALPDVNQSCERLPLVESEPSECATDKTQAQQLSPGEKSKALDIILAITALKNLERCHRFPTSQEREHLSRFSGFGPVALSIFPDPVTGHYKQGWQALGEELKLLLTAEEYESAKRTTFSQFFTSPSVMDAMHIGLRQLGVADRATVLEPGCGIGRFMTGDHRYIGVELDAISGRIARLMHPEADIRIENFRDSKLPPLDAVIGNVPFADIRINYNGDKLSLHDFFLCKSTEALKPGGILAVVTSHYSLDKQNAAAREDLAKQADFLGAIRLPSDAFKREGTAVVTDIVFLRKRAPGQAANHVDADWLTVAPFEIEGANVSVNRYFLNHPEMVLGDWSRKDTLYGGEGFSVIGNGDLKEQLRQAIERLPQVLKSQAEKANPPPAAINPAFTPPPPLRHITEGSFFVGDDHAIRQIENGNAIPVVYGSTALTDHGTMTGKRIAGLIRLRDYARRVLQSQNEGWPETNRQQARRDLNWAYDAFFHAYGPINKTSFSETKDGTQIRRMPNLVKFREDPDAMLVMSLEEYDEATGTANKAAIMKKDVVGPRPPVTHVTSAEEGLLVSLDHRGTVDLLYIAKLYGKPEAEIVTELGDLIYRDPATKEWQTADAYLSGNVREKLVSAEQAGPEYTRNAEALSQVQPEDVLPGDIDANLGAPWIPESDIQSFAAELFNVPVVSFKIGHLKQDAVWSLEPDYRALTSVAATADYGTGRINGTALLELALNLKTPAIYDTVHNGDREERVLNAEETQAAREKQKQIKEKFKTWIFSDPDRTERLVRSYNDTYNNLRPRLFDGSHLEFPGMSKAITLRPHQVDAIWRCMTAGNTLLAHAVGAGKTFEMCAAGMKMKQAGLIKKPLYCIPNHMLEQFSREFMQLYPNAKLLIANKEDFTKERRKTLTAKIATGDWDGIIVTHSSFERIGMSQEFQARFLREQIAEYDSLLKDSARSDTGRGNRNIIKTIEKQKAKREERLKDLLAEDKKDSGLVFDELGVDQIFYDEAVAVKNLETPTKMDRVAGINTGGSERAFDVYMKCRYLDEKHPGHGAVFASGTPIANSMVEMYTLQRFLDPAGLRSRGIEHFDGWAATFGEITDSMEISPDGATLKPRSRFNHFINRTELIQMFRAFADVQLADDLKLPRPQLKGGKPIVISCPMSDDQRDMQAELVRRYERIRNSKVDPREDNALAITTDGRKLALHAQLLSSTALTPVVSKLDLMVDIIADTWRETGPLRSTQLVFCDIGVNPTPWGFSVYEEIIKRLVAKGIPSNEIATIGQADTDAKKQALFEKVRNGTIRILIGSTQKMGTGTNVQRRLIAKHDLDAPWRPCDVEQRDGRILRQGNDNPEVAIYRYVTEGSFDAYMWQGLETKARFINEGLSGDCTARRAEDIGGHELSYAEVKAIASGNPAVLTLAETDAELQRLAILKKNHADEQYLARRNVRDLPGTIERLDAKLEGLTADMATIAIHRPDPLPTVEGIGKKLNSIPAEVSQTRPFKLGTYRGLEYGIIVHQLGHTDAYVKGQVSRLATMRDNPGPRAVLNAAERLIDGYGAERDDVRADVAVKQGQLRDFEARLGATFAHSDYQSKLTDLRDQLKLGLSEKAPEGGPTVAELDAQIKALRAGNAVEGTPERVGVRKAIRAEQPVTARIRKRTNEKPVIEVEAAPMETPEPITIPAPVIAIPVKPMNSFRQQVTRSKQVAQSQLRLF